MGRIYVKSPGNQEPDLRTCQPGIRSLLERNPVFLRQNPEALRTKKIMIGLLADVCRVPRIYPRDIIFFWIPDYDPRAPSFGVGRSPVRSPRPVPLGACGSTSTEWHYYPYL